MREAPHSFSDLFRSWSHTLMKSGSCNSPVVANIWLHLLRIRHQLYGRSMQKGTISLKHTLVGHQKPVISILWSPDDPQVLTCGDCVDSGDCVHMYEKGGTSPISC